MAIMIPLVLATTSSDYEEWYYFLSDRLNAGICFCTDTACSLYKLNEQPLFYSMMLNTQSNMKIK